MIATDGAATIANHGAQGGGGTTAGPSPTACERIRQARIMRALASAESAYPLAGSAAIFGEAAREAGVSVAQVEAVAPLFYGEDTTDERDHDPNRWNLH